MHLTLICFTTKYGAKISIKCRKNGSSCFLEGKMLLFLLIYTTSYRRHYNMQKLLFCSWKHQKANLKIAKKNPSCKKWPGLSRQLIPHLIMACLVREHSSPWRVPVEKQQHPGCMPSNQRKVSKMWMAGPLWNKSPQL